MLQIVVVLALVLATAFGVTLYAIYHDVRSDTIRDFDAQQALLARQAARSIEQFFEFYLLELNTLAAHPDIIRFNARGEQLMQLHYSMQRGIVSAVTRMDANGVIVYSVPADPATSGRDISIQEHVRLLLDKHEPVVSDMFLAVQGYHAVAFHVPVFDGDTFTGSIAFLIPFTIIGRDFLDTIRPARYGYAWVIDHEGHEIYGPEEGHAGKPAGELYRAYPQLLGLVGRMLKGESGTGVYAWHAAQGPPGKLIRKRAAYCPIMLDNTWWSIMVTTPESEVLAAMTSFRNHFFVVIALYTILLVLFVYISLVNLVRFREQQFKQNALLEKQQLAEHHVATQKLEAVGRLAAVVAHDLNNLLMPVLGYSELMEDDPRITGDSRQFLKEIQNATLRARDITRQLLAFARKQPLQIATVDLNEIVMNMENLIRRAIHKDVVLDIQCQAGPCYVLADRGQVEQVLLNLVMNAQDAMPRGGRLALRTERLQSDAAELPHHPAAAPGWYGILTVSDTGGGMDAATRARIFEPFFSTKGEQGTGLGLATVHGIVKQHGGSIQVASAEGQGSTFKILLPAARQPAQLASEAWSAQAEPAVRATVLLVEDDPQVLEITQQLLRQLGYAVRAASSGAEAMALLMVQPHAVDILLSDVMMPGMDGRELYERARQHCPRLRVLFMSGFTDEVLSTKGVLDPGVQLIYKPFSSTELARKLAELQS